MDESFIEFLAKSGAVKFGEFTLKSGRISPYFISTGVLSDGDSTNKLGFFYAKKIKEEFSDKFDAIYGPAYKGIPLAVSASMALSSRFNMKKSWIFDRKEKKLHGDRGAFVGADLDEGAKVIMVDDVITTGGTKIEAMEKIQKTLQAEVLGVVIAVDRQERVGRNSAVQEFSDQTGKPVYSLTNVSDIFEHLKNRKIDGKVYVDDEIYKAYLEYMKQYGV